MARFWFPGVWVPCPPARPPGQLPRPHRVDLAVADRYASSFAVCPSDRPNAGHAYASRPQPSLPSTQQVMGQGHAPRAHRHAHRHAHVRHLHHAPAPLHPLLPSPQVFILPQVGAALGLRCSSPQVQGWWWQLVQGCWVAVGPGVLGSSWLGAPWMVLHCVVRGSPTTPPHYGSYWADVQLCIVSGTCAHRTPGMPWCLPAPVPTCPGAYLPCPASPHLRPALVPCPASHCLLL